MDEDVDTEVGVHLRARGHEAWSVVHAGLGGANDDDVAAYAESENAVLVTHDAEATRRRRRMTFGQHVFLRGHQLQGVELIDSCLDTITHTFGHGRIGILECRGTATRFHPPQYEP